MSRPRTLKSLFVPPPVDGLNLIASPSQFKPTEARVLKNYRCFDSGVRQVACPVANLTVGGGLSIPCMVSFTNDSGTEKLIYTGNNKFWRLDNPTDSSATDITNGTAVSNDSWNVTYFNKRILFFNGTNTPRIHDRGAGNVTDFSATGPTVANLLQATPFKRRLYIVETSSTKFWYGDVDAFAGTFTSFDLDSVFESSGRLAFVFSWTFNQGDYNEELFCAVNENAELLVYSGDYPAAANWQLIHRAQLPAFSSFPNPAPILKTANEVYIVTSRGLIQTSSVVTGALQQRPYYTVSRNIKDQVSNPIPPVLDRVGPFIYAVAGSAFSANDIYCFNFERGAWSQITTSSVIGSLQITSMAYFRGYLMIGTGNSTPSLYNIDLDGPTGTDDLEYTWSTPFLNFGSNLQKTVQAIRMLGKNLGVSTVFETAMYMAKEFVDNGKPSPPNLTQKVDTVAQNAQVVQELSPFGGNGRWLSFVFTRDTNADTELNEYQGFEVLYEEGGLY